MIIKQLIRLLSDLITRSCRQLDFHSRRVRCVLCCAKVDKMKTFQSSFDRNKIILPFGESSLKLLRSRARLQCSSVAAKASLKWIMRTRTVEGKEKFYEWLARISSKKRSILSTLNKDKWVVFTKLFAIAVRWPLRVAIDDAFNCSQYWL